MRLRARYPVLFFSAILGTSASIAALALWILSRASTPFDYMVVGALVASVALACAFGFLVARQWL